MRKRSISLFVCICLFSICHAQRFGVELNCGPGLFIKKFTSDSLVFKHHREDERLTLSAHSSLLGKFSFKNSPISVLAGFGLRYDQLTINRKDEKGMFFNIYPDDTISIKKIRIGTDSYIFPFGLEYAFKGKPKRRHHLAARLLIMAGNAYDINANTVVDSAKQVNYPMDLQKLRSQYQQQVSRFSLTIMPQLFFSLYMGDTNLSFNLSIAPVAIDLVHVNKEYIKPGMGAMLSAGLQYEFMKTSLKSRYN